MLYYLPIRECGPIHSALVPARLAERQDGEFLGWEVGECVAGWVGHGSDYPPMRYQNLMPVTVCTGSDYSYAQEQIALL